MFIIYYHYHYFDKGRDFCLSSLINQFDGGKFYVYHHYFVRGKVFKIIIIIILMQAKF